MKSGRHVPTALLLSLALAGASVARAQDEPPVPEEKDPPKKAPPKKDPPPRGGRIRMGEPSDDAPAPPPPPADPKTPPTAEEPASEMDRWIATLSKWPAIEAKQASIRLAAESRASTPLLLEELGRTTDDWRRVCGVAATLGKIGDTRALDLLDAKLQDRRMFTHAGDLLDAILRIDPAGAKSRLLGRHLLHPAQAVVVDVAARLMPRVGPDDVPALRDVLEAGGPSARAAVVGLLVRADPVAARTSLVPALRDASPDVAFAAAKALAGDDAPEAEEALRRAVVSPVDRQISYACLGLTLRAERTGKRTIDDATARLLLGGRGLSGVDPLTRAAAAIALADLGYFHEVAVVEEVLDRKVVPALIDTVAARSFWPDMRIVIPLAARRLQRLTGRSAGGEPAEWIAWWQQAAPSFHAHRVLLEVPDDQIGSFSLTLRGPKAPGNEGTTLAVAREGLAWSSPEDFQILLPETDALALAHVVNASGVLRGGDAGISSESTVPLEAVVRAGRRERRVAFSADLAATAAAPIHDAVDRLRTRYSWQRYRTQAQALDLPSFVELYGAQFADDRPDVDRAAALAELITGALDESRGVAWNVRALEELRAIPALNGAIGDEGTRRLLGHLGRRTEIDPFAEALVRTLAKAARPEAHPLLLDFLTTRPSPLAHQLLVQTFRDAGPSAFTAGLADERLAVRVAALGSIGEGSERGAADEAVRTALKDPDVTIRREAVRALGRLRAEWARPDIEEMASKPGDLRGAAVEALGKLGGRSALGPIMSALASEDPGLRITAIEALGATREPEGISAIAFYMSMDKAAVVREVASRVLVDIGTDRAAAELRRVAMDRGRQPGTRTRAVGGLVLLQGREAARDLVRLVDDPADEVAEEAAIALAEWRDPAAVPRLLTMLEKGRQPRAARRALEGISLESFETSEPDVVASLYAGWWEAAKDRGPRGWLVDALAQVEINDPVLRTWEEGKAGRDAVPALIRGLTVPSWSVRRACDLALRDIAQRSFGDVGEFTTSADAARIAAAWSDWWSAQQEGSAN